MTKQEYRNVLSHDSICYRRVIDFPRNIINFFWDSPISDQFVIWNYIYSLRNVEYYTAKNNFFFKILSVYWLFRLRRLSYKTGFQIPPYTCGKGLKIWHWGSIIINPAARLGENCTLYPGVLIGHKLPGEGAPNIGKNCFISTGAKIIGNIAIGDNVTIAPNAVVFKNVPSNCVIAGNPAIIIKRNGVKVNVSL